MRPNDAGPRGAPAARIGLLDFAGNRRLSKVLADPPWQFTKTGKVAPEHKRHACSATLGFCANPRAGPVAA